MASVSFSETARGARVASQSTGRAWSGPYVLCETCTTDRGTTMDPPAARSSPGGASTPRTQACSRPKRDDLPAPFGPETASTSPALAAKRVAFTVVGPRENAKPSSSRESPTAHKLPSRAVDAFRAAARSPARPRNRPTSVANSPSSASARLRVSNVSNASSSARAMSQTSDVSMRSCSNSAASATSIKGVRKSDQYSHRK
mmetsp:Transcript_32086/g.108965  ORF Transcript_32086/g.108965 Transcript_32086/m.108965 type:complete len:201 (+) Transcript_32086:404-1006(+)